MITEEEYLKAKEIVTEYEKEQKCVEDELEDDWDFDTDSCEYCGAEDYIHSKNCPNADPLSYNECGYG